MIKHIKLQWIHLFMIGLIGVMLLVGCEKPVSPEAFLAAAKEGDLATIRTYIKHGGDLTVEDPTVRWNALHYAAQNCHEKVIKVLLDNGIDIDARTQAWNEHYLLVSALHIAVLEDHYDCVKLLVDKGANVHTQNWYGRGLLYLVESDKIRNLLILKGVVNH